MKIDYLFIRILEACNAGCFMCGFADSKDDFRLSLNDFEIILNKAFEEGVTYVRFTGGEPLMHADIVKFVKLVSDKGMKSSIITNGIMLESKIQELKHAGLNQVIVSLDAPAILHDKFRNRKNIFNKALSGLKMAKNLGMNARVNTVCGPDNFQYMPELQDLFTSIGVDYWELSSLKLEKKLDYTLENIAEIENVISKIFLKGKLIPFGKIWCGDTQEERKKYFATGNTPNPIIQCHIVNKVRYYDAKERKLFACSLIPHRPEALKYCSSFESIEKFSLNDEAMKKQVQYFSKMGPSVCTGCSTTAACCSDLIQNDQQLVEWYF